MATPEPPRAAVETAWHVLGVVQLSVARLEDGATRVAAAQVAGLIALWTQLSSFENGPPQVLAWIAWAIMVYGLAAWRGRFWVGGPGADAVRGRIPAFLVPLTLGVSVVVIGFFLFVTESRNYGGWTSGLRWLMWLTPLWLLTMLPVVDRLGSSRGGRIVAYLLLAVSVMSMSYPAWNPWRHPWIYRLMDESGWIPY